MSEYQVVRREIIPGTLEHFRALMYLLFEQQAGLDPDRPYLRGERTSDYYPVLLARWIVTLGEPVEQAGYIFARELPGGNSTELQFAYKGETKPIGPAFHKTYADYIIRQYTKSTEQPDNTEALLSEQSEDDHPWDKIRDRDYDRQLLKFWWNNCYEVAQIAKMLNISGSRTRNRVTELRNEYGSEIVPYKKDLGEVKKKSG
jgi:hypothetical protein